MEPGTNWPLNTFWWSNKLWNQKIISESTIFKRTPCSWSARKRNSWKTRYIIIIFCQYLAKTYWCTKNLWKILPDFNGTGESSIKYGWRTRILSFWYHGFLPYSRMSQSKVGKKRLMSLTYCCSGSWKPWKYFSWMYLKEWVVKSILIRMTALVSWLFQQPWALMISSFITESEDVGCKLQSHWWASRTRIKTCQGYDRLRIGFHGGNYNPKWEGVNQRTYFRNKSYNAN